MDLVRLLLLDLPPGTICEPELLTHNFWSQLKTFLCLQSSKDDTQATALATLCLCAV